VWLNWVTVRRTTSCPLVRKTIVKISPEMTMEMRVIPSFWYHMFLCPYSWQMAGTRKVIILYCNMSTTFWNNCIVGSRFTMGLLSRIFVSKSNRHKVSTT
jgi:hypothetical protein